MPSLITASTEEVVMGLAAEDRAIARSDEPEARSDARWRERAVGGHPRRRSPSAGRRWRRPDGGAVAGAAARISGARRRRCRRTRGRWSTTSRYCERAGVDVETAGRAEIAGYLRDLRERPGRHGANVISLDSGVGLANATLQLRVTVVRLFYDFLVEERVRDRNPVARGYRSADGRAGRRGLVARLDPLPWIPTDAQWRAILEVAAGESLRNRLMLALAYDAALRREELCLLGTDDLDPAHRTITVRAETTKSARPRRAVLGGRRPAAGRGTCGIAGRSPRRGARCSCRSRRATAAPVCRRGRGRRWCGRSRVRAGVPAFSTHTLRHLCLTDLARSGWELHQIATFAGHRSTDTTQRYIHLSGRDLAERLASGMTQIHQARIAQIGEVLA